MCAISAVLFIRQSPKTRAKILNKFPETLAFFNEIQHNWQINSLFMIAELWRKNEPALVSAV